MPAPSAKIRSASVDHWRGAATGAEITRLRRLLFAFLWRELTTSADRTTVELRTIRWAKHALPPRYRKALPKMDG